MNDGVNDLGNGNGGAHGYPVIYSVADIAVYTKRLYILCASCLPVGRASPLVTTRALCYSCSKRHRQLRDSSVT